MRILLVNTLYYPYSFGGAEKSVRTLAETLASTGDEVAVITLGEKNEFFKLNDVSVWNLKIKNHYWPFTKKKQSKINKLIWHLKDVNNKAYFKSINKVIKSFNPDIIHTNNLSGFSTYIWTIANKSKINVVHTLRDYYLQCPNSTKFKKNKVCLKPCFDCQCLSMSKKISSQNVDCVVGISDYILRDHLNAGYFSKSKKQVIFNGFKFNLDNNGQTRAEISNEKKIVFGFIGQINASKGIEILFESFSNLQGENWQLVIAGRVDDVYKNKLLKICPSNRIEFLGFVDNAFFYDRIDVLVVPSIWNEPFGRVVLEGIINKKVVLGSSVGGIPELLENNKKFIFNTTSAGLTTLLEELLNTPKMLNEFSFDNSFLLKFHIKNTVLSYRNIYKNILEK